MEGFLSSYILSHKKLLSWGTLTDPIKEPHFKSKIHHGLPVQLHLLELKTNNTNSDTLSELWVLKVTLQPFQVKLGLDTLSLRPLEYTLLQPILESLRQVRSYDINQLAAWESSTRCAFTHQVDNLQGVI